MAGIMQSMTFTGLNDRYEKEGRLRNESTGNNSDGTSNFIPSLMSAKELGEGHAKLLQGIYSEKGYFGRVFRALEDVDFIVKSSSKDLKETFGSVVKILTKENAWIYWKNLRTADKIGAKRFGRFSEGYSFILNQYLQLCAKYTHLKEQTEHTVAASKNREYQPWQLYSWKEIQESPIANFEILEEGTPSIHQGVSLRLENGYVYTGSRFTAMKQFTEPYLKKSLVKLERPLKLANLIAAEIESYASVHLERPKILGDLTLSEITHHVQELAQDKNYLSAMKQMRTVARAHQ